MTPLRFQPQSELWPLVDRAFQRDAREIRTLVPAAEVEHVGATAIPGSITKGDLDLLVRVPAGDFEPAATALGGRYAVDQPANWTDTFASFGEEREGEPPLGIQLVVSGSTVDAAFVALRRLMRSRPDLVGRANELKRHHEGGRPEAYVIEKRTFFEGLLVEVDPDRFEGGTWPWAEPLTSG